MIKQIGFEVFKMSRRPRSYIGFAALLFINSMVLLGLKYGRLSDFAMNSASGSGMQVVGSPANGEFMAWLVLASPMVSISILTMFMPFFVCLIFGEIFAGESSDGTLRMVLSKPIKRFTLLTSKFAAGLIYTLSLVLFLVVVGLSHGAGILRARWAADNGNV